MPVSSACLNREVSVEGSCVGDVSQEWQYADAINVLNSRTRVEKPLQMYGKQNNNKTSWSVILHEGTPSISYASLLARYGPVRALQHTDYSIVPPRKDNILLL